MTFSYRVKLYIFGFLIGLVALMFILKGKKCSGVSEMKLQELVDQTTYYSERAKCQLKCLNIPLDSVRFWLPAKFTINYDRSEVRDIPCGKYLVEPRKKEDFPFTLVILDCDTTSRIEKLDMKADCKCDTLPFTIP
jgi:hypothetical protein